MKNKNLFWAAVIFASLLVMALGSCGGGGEGTVTLTGIPSKFDRIYVGLNAEGINTNNELLGVSKFDEEGLG